MKKNLLISTALLATLSVVALTQTADAAPATKNLKGKVGVKFKGDTIEPEGPFRGNIVMGYVPNEINFTDNGKGLSVTDGELNVAADEYTKDRYIVVNDDRPEDKLSAWSTSLKISDISNVKKADDKLVADLEMASGKTFVYTGASLADANDNDYTMIDPTTDKTVISNEYTGAVKPAAEKYVIPASETAGAVELIGKTDKAIDPAITTQPGKDKGGQGYALELKQPRLKIKSKGTKGATYSGNMTWTLTYDDAAK